MKIFIKIILYIILFAVAAHKLFIFVSEIKIEEPTPKYIFGTKVILPLIFCVFLFLAIAFLM